MVKKKFQRCCKNCAHLICVYVLPTSRQLCGIHHDYFDTDSCCRSWEYNENNEYLKLKEFEHLRRNSTRMKKYVLTMKKGYERIQKQTIKCYITAKRTDKE